ncbi:MAG: hypothetical protein ACAI43_13135 [Phycisphaerae bacterium]|nr:hypothetical protein [Tepidisphaeraceae bacterium]
MDDSTPPIGAPSDDPGGPLELSYAPPASSAARRFVVLPIGIASTALVLAGADAAARWWEIDALSWFPFRIIPAGALLLGIVAGLGFLIAAQVAGVKPRKRFLILVGLVLVLGYLVREYVEFALLGPLVDRSGQPVNFAYYFHVKSTSISFVNRTTGRGEPLGGFGYFYRVLEMGGFVAGGVLISMLTGSGGYCELCRRFKTTRDLTAIPASAPRPESPDPEVNEQWERACEAEMERAEQRLATLGEMAVAGDAAGFVAAVDAGRPDARAARRLPVFIRVELYYCPCCFDGELLQAVRVQSELSGRTEGLPSLHPTRDFVKAVAKARLTAVKSEAGRAEIHLRVSDS